MTEPRHHLRDWREFRGLTQKELASAIDISRPYLSRIENGENDYIQYIIERIAIVLKCDVADLVKVDPRVSKPYFEVAEGIAKFTFDHLVNSSWPEKRRPKKRARPAENDNLKP